MTKLFLRDSGGRLIRAVLCGTEKAFAVCSRTGRLDISSSPDFLESAGRAKTKKSARQAMAVREFSLEQLKKGPFQIALEPHQGPRLAPRYSGYTIELAGGSGCQAEGSETISAAADCRPEDSKLLWQAAAGCAAAFALLIGGLFALSGGGAKPAELPKKLRSVQIIQPQQIAKIEKISINSQTAYTRDSQAPAKKKRRLKKSLSRRGALAALGSLSKSRNPAGLRLKSARVASLVSPGPGLGGAGASGGVQSSIYSKGLVTAALGAGGNIRGGGGYGLKGGGAGGGEAGAGQLSLIGSGGSGDLSETSLISQEGGSFDPSLIDREIIRHIGKIRECYNKALRREPNLKGLFNAHFTINRRGRVASSKRHPSSAVRSPDVTRCILGELNKIQFNLKSERQGLISVVYPFDLAALGEQASE